MLDGVLTYQYWCRTNIVCVSKVDEWQKKEFQLGVEVGVTFIPLVKTIQKVIHFIGENLSIFWYADTVTYSGNYCDIDFYQQWPTPAPAASEWVCTAVVFLSQLRGE